MPIAQVENLKDRGYNKKTGGFYDEERQEGGGMTHSIQRPNPVLQFRNAGSRRGRTDGIVIHHLAANVSVQTVHSWHLGNGWAGIGYHFQVDKDGRIWQGRPVDIVGAHTGGHNANTIGIAVQGNYHTVSRIMPDVQFNALVWLIQHLRGIYGNLRMHAHRELTATACPGQHFPMDELRRLQFRQTADTTRPEVENDMTEARVREWIEEVVWAILSGEGTTPSAWAEGEFAEAIAAGLTDGTRPRGFATRQEQAVVAFRALRAAREG